MKLRRTIAAVPLRSGAATWDHVVDLITGADSVDAHQLRAAASVMATLLSEEHHANHPLVLEGVGHRLVVYCAYGADALLLGEDVDALGWNPTAGNWSLSVPCADEDIDWVKTALAARATRIAPYKTSEGRPETNEAEPSAKASYDIDWSAAR